MADIESNIRFGIDTTDAIASIKTLQAQISAFQKQMATSSSANADSARKLRRGLIDDLNATGQWSASIKTIKSTSESFTTALEKNKLSMGEYFRYAGASTKTFGKLFSTEFNTIEKVARERVKTLQTQYIALGRDANGALQSIAVRPLKLDMESLATQTAINAQKQQLFSQLLKQGSTNLLNFGKNTQWAGRQLMVGFTIPLSIFGSAASKTFMELEQQAIRFKRVYGDLFTPPEETNQMLEQLKELSKEFTKYGVAVEKTMGLAADAAAMGKTGTALLSQVTEANRLAVLGNVEQAQALETTISMTNAFGIATKDLASKINFLNAVENQTVVSIEDLTEAIPKAGPVVQQLGGNVEDLAFFLTAMKEGGINASEGANALKSGLASLINPTGQASTMLKTFGINIKEISANNVGDVKGLVVDFARALDDLNPSQRAQAIEQLFGKFQFSRLSTLFQNVIQEGNQASRVLELTNATTQELAQLSSKELKSVEESTTFRFKKAIEEFRLAIAPVGEEFLKLITPVIEFATKIIEKFNDLGDGAKSFITGLVVLFGAIGPVALMTFGLLANGLANIVKGFQFLRDLFLKTGNQSTVLGEQIDYMTNEQLNAAAVAASLDQTHQKLIQTFSVEAGAVANLAEIYKRAFTEQQKFDTGRKIAGGMKLASGIVSVPGPKGAGDVVPAMLSPGEAVIPADKAKQYAPLIQGMIAGNLPGFVQGTAGAAAGVAMDSQIAASYASLQTVIPNIMDIVETAMTRLADAGKKLSQANLDKEIEKIAGPIVKLARTTTAAGAAAGGSASSASGVNLAHGAPMVKLPQEIARALGEELQRQGITNIASRTLAGADKDVNAYGNMVFPMPRGFNAGQVSGKDSAEFIRKDPSMFTSVIADMYQVDRNDPELLKFGESVASGLEQAGERAITDGEFYDIVFKAMNEMTTSAAKAALEKSRTDLSTVADPKDRREPLYFGKSISAETPAYVPGQTAMTASAAELDEGKSYVQYRGSAAGKSTMAEANALADEFITELVRAMSARLAAGGLDQVGGVVADEVKAGLGINSPSAEYEGISNDVTAGVRQGKDDALMAGEELGEATATGVRVGKRRVTTNPDVIAAASSGGTTQSGARVPRRAVRPGDKEVREAAEAAAAGSQKQGKSALESAAKLNKLNSAVMSGTFALTSLAGMGIMAGGVVGQVSQKIFEFSGILFALMNVIQMITKEEVISLAIKRWKMAQEAIEIATTTGKIAANGGFIASMVTATVAVNAFLGPIGLVVLGLIALVGVISLLIGAHQEQQKKINGLGDAAYLTSEKMKKAGDLLGFDAKTTAFGQNIQEGTAAGRTSTESTMIQDLRSSETFKTDFSGEIEGIKNATKAQAEATLASVSAQLQAAGAPVEAVDAYVRAIAQEAGRTDLQFKFASIDFTTQGKDQIIANAKSMVTDFENAVANNQDVDKMKAAFAGTMAASLQALKDGLANNLLTAEDFNAGLTGVMATLEGLSDVELATALPSLYEKLGIKDLMKDIPNVQDQLLLLKADAAGIQITDTDKDALKNAGKSARANAVALAARKKIKKAVEEQALAQQEVNAANEAEALINEDIASANTQLADRVVQLQNQQAAYQILIDQGYDAATAFDLAGDAGLAAGIKAAYGAGIASTEWKDMKSLLDQVTALEAKAPKGGGGEKSPIEKANESLKQQREELKNSLTAYSRLSKAGFDVASAMTAAEDPILAAALATTKVGSKAWDELVKKIKEVQSLLSKKELQDLIKGGKVDIADKKAQVKVSNALATLKWTMEDIDAALSDQKFTNALAKDLEDGVINSKDLLNRLSQIKQLGNLDIVLNLTTKEGAADEFQKIYDKAVGSLEAQKQVIEVDFQIKTAADEKIVKDAESSIAAIQYQVDDYEAQLTGIEEQEAEINKAYDERQKALEKVAKANEAISKQQKNQLTLADALSQGDIAAAARAAQDMRAQSSQDSIAQQGELLDLSRQRELSNVRGTGGQSRVQIEDSIKKLKKDIFDIEEKTLEPARERIRLATVDKDKQLESLNAQILKWDELSAKVNAAKLKLTPEEMTAMKTQAGLIADLLTNWDNIKDKTATLTIIKKTLGVEDDAPVVKDDKPTGGKSTGGKSTGGNSTITKTKTVVPSVTGKYIGSQFVVDKPGTKTTTTTPTTKPTTTKPTTTKPDLGALKFLQDDSVGKAISTGLNNVIGGIGNFFASIKFSSGGMVPKYFASGGFARGTDTVPAMLTPGEFVVKKYAVDNFGVDKLKSINNGTFTGDSMYNYEVNVNVRTDANSSEIARSVIDQIKKIDSQRIRSNRF